MSGTNKSPTGVVRKTVIVLLLVGGVILLNRFAVRSLSLDPTAMLALGFVILASYAFGQLVERFGLPHITGYLIAGFALGPSVAERLPHSWRVSPFDHGLLSDSVQHQLDPLQTLAIALIALSAGGELKIGPLRRQLGRILGILGGQTVMVLGLSAAFLIVISGALGWVRLPGLGQVTIAQAALLGAVVGCVSLATSPSATLAVINDARARGPYTSSVLTTVVLKDVVVVVLFSVISTLALSQLTDESELNPTALALYLLSHIGGALLLGGAIGLVIVLYLRYVKSEALLFLVGIVFTAQFLGSPNQLDVEPVVLFLTAGFVTVNFSKEGDQLVDAIETLSLPVYVVFFTLAGAHLDLTILISVAGFAAALVAIRVLGMWSGTWLGALIGRAPGSVRRLGFLGFASQAGVAITLANIIGARFGATGASLKPLIIAGIAINEVIGPILLKLGLSLAGESGAKQKEEEEETSEETRTASGEAPGLAQWPKPTTGVDAWGDPLASSSAELERAVYELTDNLVRLCSEAGGGPIEQFRLEAEDFVRGIRREFLRHHRRITVQALDDTTELNAPEALRLEQAELAEKWRGAVLVRSSHVAAQPPWDARNLSDSVELIADLTPERIDAVYEPGTFVSVYGDSFGVRLGRSWLRLRRGINRLFGDRMPVRRVPLRALARFHLWGRLPERLEPVAALFAQAESHLTARVRGIFDEFASRYDRLAEQFTGTDGLVGPAPSSSDPDVADEEAIAELENEGAERAKRRALLETQLRELRHDIDEELRLAIDEVDRIAADLRQRLSEALGHCLRDLKKDALLIGTPELSTRRRSASRLYAKRESTLNALERGLGASRETAAAVYNRLALEMELIALSGRVKDVLDEHADALARDVRGRAHRQLTRVHVAIVTARTELSEALARRASPEELINEIRELVQAVARTAADAIRAASQLSEQLSDEGALSPVLDTLTRAAQALTDRYRIPSGHVARGEFRLPPSGTTVEVPFREWMLARIETTIAPRLVAALHEASDRVKPISDALRKFDGRIAFNSQLAADELSVVEEDNVPESVRTLIHEVLDGSLGQSQELFGTLSRETDAWADLVRDSLRSAVLDRLAELRGELVDGEVAQLRSQMVRDVRGRRVVHFFSDLRSSIASSAEIAASAAREGVGPIRLDRARALLGLKPADAPVALGERPFDPPIAPVEIPLMYRRLFAAQALESSEILLGRESALSDAMQALTGHSGGGPRAVAVVGLDGVGKAALVNALGRGRRWAKVRQLSIDAPADARHVTELFEPASEGHLVVVSGLQWLCSLKPGGFDPLRRFVDGVMADRGRNAYIVQADSLVWELANSAAPLREAVQQQVFLEPLDAEALKSAVMARHNHLGYGLVFRHGPEPKSRLEEWTLRATSPFTRPQQRFFRALHNASGGVLRDALRLWLASVEAVDEVSDFVHLGPVPTPPIHALRALEEHELLVLYQIARQGWTDESVHRWLFRCSATSARAQLSSLTQRGILVTHGPVYRIAYHLRSSVVRVLEDKEMLS